MPKIGKTAFVFSTLLGLSVTLPLAGSFAASPNAINNQTAQLPAPVKSELGRQLMAQVRPDWRGTGVYDGYDSYRGPNGFPLPGTAQLFEPLD